MKILYLSYTMPKPSSPRRGVFLLRRIEELIKQGISPTINTTEHLFNIFKYKKKYNFKDIGYNVDCEVNSLVKIENPFNYYNLIQNINETSIYKIFKQNNCDLIHAHFIRDGILANSLKKRYSIPFIITSHGFDIRNLEKGDSKLLIKSLEVLENSDKAIFVSNSLLNTAIRHGYSGLNSVVVNNGYNSDIFFHNEQIVKKENFNIGFAGKLNLNKRADKLPVLLNIIKGSIPKVKMIIIGDGQLKKQMIKEFGYLKVLEDVTFTGNIPQEEMSRYMNQMDVFILPSIREGFPTVVAEAMACGVQVVASDADGSPEAVANAGYIVEQGKPEFEKRFAEQVIYAMKKPIPKEMVLERAKELTWKKIVKKEINVYEEVLNTYAK